MQDIADALSITNSGASQAVDQIEKAGHARRLPNPADRRSSLVELTAACRTVLENAATSLDRVTGHHLATLPADTMTQLGQRLTQLAYRLGD